MYCTSCSPQRKCAVSWEVRDRRYFSSRRRNKTSSAIAPVLPLFSLPINRCLTFSLSLSKNPTGIWLARITNVLINNYISPSLMIGIPTFRTRVLYVPQRPSLLPGSPRDFLYSVSELKSHKDHRNEKSDKGAPHIILRKAQDISEQWGVDEELWERDWSNLSGGEAQRIALAIALVMDTAEIMLLDGLCSKFFSSRSCWMNGFF